MEISSVQPRRTCAFHQRQCLLMLAEALMHVARAAGRPNGCARFPDVPGMSVAMVSPNSPAMRPRQISEGRPQVGNVQATVRGVAHPTCASITPASSRPHRCGVGVSRACLQLAGSLSSGARLHGAGLLPRQFGRSGSAGVSIAGIRRMGELLTHAAMNPGPGSGCKPCGCPDAERHDNATRTSGSRMC